MREFHLVQDEDGATAVYRAGDDRVPPLVIEPVADCFELTVCDPGVPFVLGTFVSFDAALSAAKAWSLRASGVRSGGLTTSRVGSARS